MVKYMVSGDWFNGHEISAEGKRCGFVDYACLASGINHVLNNDILKKTRNIGEWELINGSIFEFDEEGKIDGKKEVFQYFIIDCFGANTLIECTDEIVYYSDTLGMYVWGITHFGTGWDYVLTDIPAGVGHDAWQEWYNNKLSK